MSNDVHFLIDTTLCTHKLIEMCINNVFEMMFTLNDGVCKFECPPGMSRKMKMMCTAEVIYANYPTTQLVKVINYEFI